MRIFIGLDIDDQIREHIARFMDGVREFAADARWVRPESMHVTLKFIGEKAAAEVEEIRTRLKQLQGTTIDISFRGYGFFPTTRSPRLFWVGLEAGHELTRLAAEIDESMSALRIPKEDHPFSPHLTLARASGRRGQKRDPHNSDFKRLQEKLSMLPQPDFGSMTARAFYLYESKLGPGGSKYTKLEQFPLNPS
jgi:RNA 2',3'-cyclic 3'-phosphodiesterase